VYCYQVGTDDCYKIGRTTTSPEKRRRGFSTGSPKKFTLYREIETEFPTHLEKHIHQLLDPRRAENGEFFNVSRQELDEAIQQAVTFVSESRPLVQQANRLKKKKPTEAMRQPSEQVRELYRQLREATRQKFLADRRFEMLRTKMQVEIGEDLGITGIASWPWRECWTFDVKLFEKKHKKLYQRFLRNSGSRYFELERLDLTHDV
jgi:exonuclease VII large subunit